MKVLYFSAEFCGPCKQVKPRMQIISDVQYLDAEKDKEEFAKYRVTHVPTVIILEEKKSTKLNGAEAINDWLESQKDK